MRRTFLLAVVALSAAASLAHAQGFLGQSMKEWMTDLNDPSAEVRRGAAFALGKLGARADTPRIVAALTHGLTDKDAAVRDVSASGLGDVLSALDDHGESFWAKTGPALQQALRDDDAHVRRSAAYALGAFGPAAVPAREDILVAAADRSALVRQNAAYAIGKLGKDAGQNGVEKLRDLFKDEEPLVRRDALHALGEVGNPTAHAAVAAMMKAAGEENDAVVRKAAVEALSRVVGPEDAADAPTLYPLLQDKDSETRYNAAFVLSLIGGRQGVQALPVLRQELADDNPVFQEQAAAAIGALGKDGAPAVEDLGNVLTTAKSADVRRNAALALARIGPPSAKALTQIVQALQYSDAPADAEYNKVRPYAAEALLNVQLPGSEPSIPAVLKIIRSDPDPLVRQRCLWTLFKVDDLDRYKITPVLTAVLEEAGPDAALLRYDSARLLARHFGDKAPDRTPDVLLEMLKSRGLVQFNKTDTKSNGVGSEGNGAKTMVSDDQGGDARYMAAEALGWLRGKANRPDIIQALQQATKDMDPKLRDAAAEALKQIK